MLPTSHKHGITRRQVTFLPEVLTDIKTIYLVQLEKISHVLLARSKLSEQNNYDVQRCYM